MPYSAKAADKSSIAKVYFLSLVFFPCAPCNLQCCRESDTMSYMNFWAAIAMSLIIRWSLVCIPETFRKWCTTASGIDESNSSMASRILFIVTDGGPWDVSMLLELADIESNGFEPPDSCEDCESNCC